MENLLNFIKVAAISVLALVPGIACAEGEPGLPALICEASGYDVILHNKGSSPIAVGTIVDWSVPFARRQGQHRLAKAMQPDTPVVLSGVLGSTFLNRSKLCAVTIA